MIQTYLQQQQQKQTMLSVCKLACGKNVNIILKMILSCWNIQVRFDFHSCFDFSFEQYGQERLSPRLPARQVLMCAHESTHICDQIC